MADDALCCAVFSSVAAAAGARPGVRNRRVTSPLLLARTCAGTPTEAASACVVAKGHVLSIGECCLIVGLPAGACVVSFA